MSGMDFKLGNGRPGAKLADLTQGELFMYPGSGSELYMKGENGEIVTLSGTWAGNINSVPLGSDTAVVPVSPKAPLECEYK